MTRIAAANGIVGPDYFIQPGQSLTIPRTSSSTPSPTTGATRTHIVRSTDTLSSIGALYGVNWLDIAGANGISGPLYIVRSGQVLTIPQPGATTPTSPPTPPAAPTAPTSAPPASGTRTHTVTSTDTLSGIGALYGVDWLQIAAANGIAGPDYFIRSGQVLTIPAAPAPGASTSTGTGRTYLVSEGETLSEIGIRVGVPWLQIAQANGITGPFYIVRGGQTLIIP